MALATTILTFLCCIISQLWTDICSKQIVADGWVTALTSVSAHISNFLNRQLGSLYLLGSCGPPGLVSLKSMWPSVQSLRGRDGFRIWKAFVLIWCRGNDMIYMLRCQITAAAQSLGFGALWLAGRLKFIIVDLGSSSWPADLCVLFCGSRALWLERLLFV